MTKTQIRNEFNRIKKENNYFLKGYNLVFDYGWLQEVKMNYIGLHLSADKEIRLNQDHLNREDIVDILIHEIAHAWVSWRNNNYVNKITDMHGEEWYSKYLELGGKGSEEYRLGFAKEGITVIDGSIMIG